MKAEDISDVIEQACEFAGFEHPVSEDEPPVVRLVSDNGSGISCSYLEHIMKD